MPFLWRSRIRSAAPGPPRCCHDVFVADGVAVCGHRAGGWLLGLSSEVGRLPVRPPALAKVLDDPFGLFVADLYEFVSKVAVFPLDDRGSERPAEVLPQAIVGEPVAVELQSAYQPVRIVDRPILADDGVVSDLVWHLESLLEVRNVCGAVWDLYVRRHLALEALKLATFLVSGLRAAQSFICFVGRVLLGVEALGCVELHLEPLSLLGHPPCVDSFVLRIGPVIGALVHLMSRVLQPRLDVVIAPDVVVRLEAAREAQSIWDLPQDCG